MNSRNIYTSIAFLAVIGMVVSIYMTYAHYNSAGFCPSAEDENSCDIVNQSRYSEIFGIPVPAIGIGGYFGLLIASLLKLLKPGVFRDMNFYIFMMGVTGFGFTLYLKYLELFVLHEICYYCLISAFAITFIFLLSISGIGKE